MDQFESSHEEDKTSKSESERRRVCVPFSLTIWDHEPHIFPPTYTHESSMISKPQQALLEMNPGSYSPHILTIGPFYQMLDGNRSFDHYKLPCVDGFMRRHRI